MNNAIKHLIIISLMILPSPLCQNIGAQRPMSQPPVRTGQASIQEGLSLDEVVEGKYAAKRLPAWQSMKDGQSYVALSDNGRQLLRYDYKSGKLLETVIDLDKTRGESMERIEGYCFNAQENKLLLWQHKQAIYRRSFTADYYVYDRLHNSLEVLSDKGRQRDAAFSPDGRMVAFARDNNLYIKKLDFKTEVAVTTDGQAGKVINGTSDWLYEEEFSVTRMYQWTADSRYLCFVRFDESQVREYGFAQHYCGRPELDSCRYYPGEVRFKYPRAGENNSRVSLHAYQVQYRQVTRLELPLGAEDYLPRLYCPRQANQLAVAVVNRLQNELKLYMVNPKSRLSQLLLSERSESYVDPSHLDDIQFTAKDFTFVSERDGYRHLYLYRLNGTLAGQITRGQDELIAYYGRDTLKNVFYWQGVDGHPWQHSVFRTDAKGKTQRIGQGGGYSSARFNSTYTCFVEDWSTANRPDVCTLRDAANGRQIRVVEDNAALVEAFNNLPHSEKEFFETVAADGQTVLYGWMMKPFGFDASKKYPVLLVQYSGPDSQQAIDRYKFDWEYFLTSNGYAVVCVDGRGTGGRGEAFRKCTYMNLGGMECADQQAVALSLAREPWVDAGRIGIWGWSYGGYVTLLAMTEGSQVFQAGIAVAPVTDFRYYNTAYTERFMRRPQENAAGYDRGSALLHADRLKGHLLIVHGLADDNVHVNQSMELIDELVRAGKQFDTQLYPGRNHSILGQPYRKHLYHRWWRFLQENL